jgi:hypothetical protein
MTVMSRLAQRIQDAKVDLSADVDLPLSLINIYACSVYRFDGKHPVHTYVAAIHTAVAVAKLADWCEERHNFRPLRSTCKTPVRRLKMADLIENPAAFDSALRNAKDSHDEGAVYALRRLPRWISEQTGVAMPVIDGEFATRSLWGDLKAAFTAEVGHA